MNYSDILPLGISCSFFGIPASADLENCRDSGFSMLEVCVVKHWMTQSQSELAGEWRALASKAAELNLSIWSVHLPYAVPFDISRLEPGMADRAVQLHQALMETAAGTLQPKKFILHASHEPIGDAEREQRMQRAIQSLQTLTQTAAGLGGQLCVECLPRTCIGRDTAEIARLTAGQDQLGICCDTNHLLTERAEDFIAAFPGRIASLHLSDYDGIDERHWLPGRGINNWNAILEALRKSGYIGPLMLEVRGRAAEERVTLEETAAAAQKLRKVARQTP